MNKIRIFFLLLLTAGFAGSCNKDRNDFSGADNYIASFHLKKGDVTLKASISPGSIVVTAPEGFDLSGANAAVILSENAKINPDPASISDWTKEQTFTITSYNGSSAAYKYSLVRNEITKEGDVVLQTQADVEALAALKLTQINGNLTIGAATGQDSIYSLDALSNIKNIRYGLTINATYAGKDLASLSNLEKVGALQILQNRNLKTVSLPKLTSVVSDLIVNQSWVERLDFPALTGIDKGLQILNTDSLAEMNFANLKNIVENLTLQASSGVNKLKLIQFPALEKAGGNTTITNWKEVTSVNIPLLASTGTLSVTSMPKMTSFSMPQLKRTGGTITMSNNALMTVIDLGSLTTAEGDFRIENNAALENLNGLKALTGTYGELFISNLSKLKNIDGLKALKSVGKRLYMSSLTQLEDETLSGLSNLSNVGGDIVISQVKFRKFSGFALTTAINLGIYGNGLSSIEEIDVHNIGISGQLTLSNITTAFSLKGKNAFAGNVSIENSNLGAVEGFEEVNNLTYNMNLNTQTERTVNFKKVNGDLTLSVYNFSSFKMPLLEEVKGKFMLSTSTGIQSLSFPALKKIGSATLDAAQITTFELPALQVVDGNLSITTGRYQTDILASLQLPQLTTVNGILTLAGNTSTNTNSKMKDLNGFSALRILKGVVINYNIGLTDYTGLKNALSSMTATDWKVSGNNYNPSYQDMLDGKYVKP